MYVIKERTEGEILYYYAELNKYKIANLKEGYEIVQQIMNYDFSINKWEMI